MWLFRSRNKTTNEEHFGLKASRKIDSRVPSIKHLGDKSFFDVHPFIQTSKRECLSLLVFFNCQKITEKRAKLDFRNLFGRLYQLLFYRKNDR